MKKKIISIAITAVMALGVFAFTGCDLSSDLSEYKATAEAAIQDHADTKIAENSYTEEVYKLSHKRSYTAREPLKTQPQKQS